MTDNIIDTCRREAQAWIEVGIGDGWPLTQAADCIESQQAEIKRLRVALALAVGELSTHGEHRLSSPGQLMQQFIEEASYV
jgi:hypothetical protein